MKALVMSGMIETGGEGGRGVCNVVCLFAEVAHLLERGVERRVGGMEEGGEATEGCGVGGEGFERALQLGGVG